MFTQFTKESAESIHAFMALNEMPVYKFSVVEVVPEETEMTGMKTATRMTNNCKIMTWERGGGSRMEFDLADDWRAYSDNDSD